MTIISKPKILVIDDDHYLSKLLEFKFSREGFEVCLADDGQAGLDKIKSFRPDLVILDGLLPVLDGHEVLQQLRQDEQSKNLPVIMLTGLDHKQAAALANGCIANEFIAKPFKMADLLSSIMRHLPQGTDMP